MTHRWMAVVAGDERIIRYHVARQPDPGTRPPELPISQEVADTRPGCPETGCNTA